MGAERIGFVSSGVVFSWLSISGFGWETAFDFHNLQSTICSLKWYGPLAQMEEHLIFNPVAAGSNPARPNLKQ